MELVGSPSIYSILVFLDMCYINLIRYDQGNCGICETSLRTSIAILQKPTYDSLQKLTNTLHTLRPCFFKSITILSSHPIMGLIIFFFCCRVEFLNRIVYDFHLSYACYFPSAEVTYALLTFFIRVILLYVW